MVSNFEKGSYFCNSCQFLENSTTTSNNISSNQYLHNSLIKHRDEIKSELPFKIDSIEKAVYDPDGEAINSIFEYVEKVQFPHLLRQPGQ